MIRVGRLPLFFAGALLHCSAAPSPETALPKTGADDPPEVSVGAPAPVTCAPARFAQPGADRLALLIGVGRFASKLIPALDGPANDVLAMHRLLTAPRGGFGFAASEVCALTDDRATEAAVGVVLDRMAAAAQAGTEVFIYFSGHGTQLPDEAADEPDNMDEALVVHDGALRDDWMYAKLAAFKKTVRVTYLVDAANSATMAKTGLPVQATDARSRYVSPAMARKAGLGSADADRDASDGAAGFGPDGLPNVVFIGGAQDGSNAIEKGDRGVFSSAWIAAAASSAGNITFDQLRTEVLALLGQAGASQLPAFSGDLDRVVLGTQGRRRAVWVVRQTAENQGAKAARIEGLAWPGWATGGEVTFFPPTSTDEDLADPKAASGLGIIESFKGIEADVRLTYQSRRAVRAGDLVVLKGGSLGRVKMDVVLKTKRALAQRIKRKLQAHPVVKNLVRVVQETRDGFTVRPGPGGVFDVFDASGTLRNRLGSTDDLIARLELHARQRPLLALRGEPGKRFVNNSTLQVQLKTVDRNGNLGGGVNDLGEVPVCRTLAITVRYAGRSGDPTLEVGGALVGNDGSIFGFPVEGRTIKMRPGEERTLIPNELLAAFVMAPPVGAPDRILVAGLPAGTDYPWHALTTLAPQAAKGTRHPLADRLDAFLTQRPTPAGTVKSLPPNQDPWTTSVLTIRSGINRTKEITLASFDVTPFLPANPKSALHRVLKVADRLAKYSKRDGVPYKQHGWRGRTDAANLKRGIDCSRSIWYAFTRANGPGTPRSERIRYTNEYLARKSGYYPTADMVGTRSPMNRHFVSCDGKPLKTGDVIVYRRDTARDPKRRRDGHVVMVIDPVNHIAWGSHGFDGGSGGSTPGDTGVEYQQVGGARQWDKWDARTMRRVACWRHKRFIKEERSGLAARDPSQTVLNADYCSERTVW